MSVSSGMAVPHEDRHETSAAGAPRLRLVRGEGRGREGGAAARWIGTVADRLMCRSSLVPVAPLLDVRAFEWTRDLRAHWRVIRDEARECAAATAVSAAHHPATAAILSRIPGLHAAWFELLPSGAHAVARPRGGRALLTCHLGLAVPRDGDLRMRLGERVVRWAQGETLLFDATQAPGWWNDNDEAGLVLAAQMRRPMRQPGRWIAEALLR
jgi:aspartyl/asparaginyl beta-hydroxylase (cupin superfamily)